MNRSLPNTANCIRGRVASWQNHSTSMDPLVERVLTGFEVLGYTVLLQSDLVSGRHQTILQNYRNGILGDRFCQAMQRINPTVPVPRVESILDELTVLHSRSMLQQNRRWHLQLLEGIALQPSAIDSSPFSTLQLIDYSNLLNNDWLAIYSFPVVETEHQHSLDLVIFINGFPLAVFHGFDTGEKSWSLRAAYLQLQGYKIHLPKFFSFNELLVLSNGTQSRLGTLSNQWKQFIPIHSANGEDAPLAGETEIETLIQCVFDKRRLLEIIQHCIFFQQSKTLLSKRLRYRPFCTVKILR